MTVIARLLVIIALLGGIAHADDKPWAAGVSAKDQATALAIYRDGNAYFEKSQFKDALVKYELALASWDHPAIRYNAAVCLINLDRPVDAYDNLEAALRFGPAPLGDLFAQGQTYMHMLSGQIAELEVQCSMPDAQITLDGKTLLACPGGVSRHVRPGEHQLVGAKPKFQTETRSVVLSAGKKTTLVIELKPLAVATTGRLARRFPVWLPWAVVAGGAVLGIASGLELRTAGTLYDNYDRAFKADCPTGCLGGDPNASAAHAIQARADRDQHLALGFAIGGGAAIATGLALVYLNQGHIERSPVIAPQVRPDGAGVSLSMRW